MSKEQAGVNKQPSRFVYLASKNPENNPPVALPPKSILEQLTSLYGDPDANEFSGASTAHRVREQVNNTRRDG